MQKEETTQLDVDGMKVLIPKTDNLYDFATKVNDTKGAVDLYELERNRSFIPPVEARNQSMNFNRNTSQGRGPYQIAIKAERRALAEGLKTYAEIIGMEPAALEEMVFYIPNSRFAYYNKLIKKALEGIATQKRTVTPADIEYINTVWMNDRVKETLRTLLNKALDPKRDGYSILPTPSRSGIAVSDAPGIGTGTYISLRNPGNVYLPIEENIGDKIRRYSEVVQPIQELVNQINQQIATYENTKILDEIDMDPKIKRLIDQTRASLYERHISYDKMMEISKAFAYIADVQSSKYLLSLIDPFTHRFTKMPNEVPIPSCTFSLRSNLNLTTNAGGLVAFAWSPFYITTSALGTFGVNNNVALVGTASSAFFLGTSVGQSLPVALYIRYRLVSAALKLTFTSSLLNTSGFATMGVDFISMTQQAAGTAIPEYSVYGDFSRIENTYFKQSLPTRSGETMQTNYIPLDSSFGDYEPVSTLKPGFVFAGYIAGAPASTTVARVDLVANFEAIVDPAYVDYLPAQIYTGSLEDFKTAISVVSLAPNLSPVAVQKVITENTPQKLEKQIELPPDKRSISIANNLKKVAEEVRDRVISEITKEEKPSQRKGIIDSIMDFISPVASGIVKTAAGTLTDLFMPGLGMLKKF